MVLIRDAFEGKVSVAAGLHAVEYVFASHGEEVDAIEPGPGTLFCDVTPSAHRAAAWVDAGAIVLDHHETARDVVALFGDRGVYGQGLQSGAVLAHAHVWLALVDADVQRAMETTPFERNAALGLATMAGVRDTWQRSHALWERACEQADGLAFFPWERIAEVVFAGDGAFGPKGRKALDDIRAVGKVVRANRLAQAQAAANGAMWFTTDGGTRVAVVNELDTSDVTDFVPAADVVAGFRMFASREPIRVCRWSLRSRGGYDVGAVAKANGGGGHRAAAGFTEELPNEQPMWSIARALCLHEYDIGLVPRPDLPF